eukprot:1892572-Rhodomonas_salina.1
MPARRGREQRRGEGHVGGAREERRATAHGREGGRGRGEGEGERREDGRAGGVPAEHQLHPCVFGRRVYRVGRSSCLRVEHSCVCQDLAAGLKRVLERGAWRMRAEIGTGDFAKRGQKRGSEQRGMKRGYEKGGLKRGV